MGGMPRVLALLAAVAACGDFTDRQDGGADDEPLCLGEQPLSQAWPIESAIPGGSIELGIDRSGFEPLPDELTFIEGGQTQGGVLLILQARMVGLDPGTQELLDPRNPRVRFSGTFLDGTVFGRDCPSRGGFVPLDEGGAFELRYAAFLEFEPLTEAERGFNTVVKLKVEVIDVDGRHASDEREVFCRAPAGWDADAGLADAGLADAGSADAGPEADGGADAFVPAADVQAAE